MDQQWTQYREKIASARNAAELDAVEQELFGRKAGVLTLALKGLGELAPEERRTKAESLNQAKLEMMFALDERKKELMTASRGSLLQNDQLDITLTLPKTQQGHLHLVPEFIARVEEVFGRMGFDTAQGPELETEDYNFNLLNIPETHPARDMQDTFWVNRDLPPGERTVLRTHTSPGQIRYMQNHKPPFRAIFPGKVYRKDADATHSPMFHQFEGLMIGKDISLANMKAVMITAMRELIAPDIDFRFRTGFFPFVEPGLEVDIRWRGSEDASREGRWMEVVGCGMTHPQVLKNCGIDPTKWQGFAFGFGVERMIMLKHQIPDLRLLFEGDVRFLEQF